MKIYRYKVKIPDSKGKLKEIMISFTTKDLEKLFDYYKVPYKKVD